MNIDYDLLADQARALGRLVHDNQLPTLGERELLEGLWELCHSLLDRGQR